MTEYSVIFKGLLIWVSIEQKGIFQNLALLLQILQHYQSRPTHTSILPHTVKIPSVAGLI